MYGTSRVWELILTYLNYWSEYPRNIFQTRVIFRKIEGTHLDSHKICSSNFRLTDSKVTKHIASRAQLLKARSHLLNFPLSE